MILYYEIKQYDYGRYQLLLFTDPAEKDFEHIWIVDCRAGDNILFIVEKYFADNNIDIKFTQLLAV